MMEGMIAVELCIWLLGMRLKQSFQAEGLKQYKGHFSGHSRYTKSL